MISVKVVKVPAIMRGKILLSPELAEGIETIGSRLARPGRGIAERRNSMNRERGLLSQRFTFQTIHYPRRTGSVKRKKMIAIFRSMSGNVLRKVVQRIAAKWKA